MATALVSTSNIAIPHALARVEFATELRPAVLHGFRCDEHESLALLLKLSLNTFKEAVSECIVHSSTSTEFLTIAHAFTISHAVGHVIQVLERGLRSLSICLVAVEVSYVVASTTRTIDLAAKVLGNDGGKGDEVRGLTNRTSGNLLYEKLNLVLVYLIRCLL